MAAALSRSRVAFNLVEADDAEGGYVSPESSEIDLTESSLRAIISPEGARLGKITLTTGYDAAGWTFGPVSIPLEFEDVDEHGVLLLIDKDLPLMKTRITVESPLDEPFELLLITAHRG